ncbi:hypothetical protein DSCA_57420 [Desulfosarcina alkanivorans]|jgi:hypothetical protein|uniref:Uncharacterized protein n=1 Tax=Desulfosarcina alkanivorans TaxID=571177 RepID=A0A5K7YPX8_9BACT|nr:hypothetical protein DSCA_57420 [Desulfosarcina alkanivorans]
METGAETGVLRFSRLPGKTGHDRGIPAKKKIFLLKIEKFLAFRMLFFASSVPHAGPVTTG